MNFNNLTVGNLYRITVSPYITIANTYGYVRAMHNGKLLVECSNQNLGTDAAPVDGMSNDVVFIATATTIEFVDAGAFAFSSDFREHLLRINKNEPSFEFASLFLKRCN